eukprot:9910321-Alexandrium_andersonii.AAC.1
MSVTLPGRVQISVMLLPRVLQSCARAVACTSATGAARGSAGTARMYTSSSGASTPWDRRRFQQICRSRR